MQILWFFLWYKKKNRKPLFQFEPAKTKIDWKMLTCVCRPVSSNLPKLAASANVSPKKRQQNQLYHQQQKGAINVVTCEPKIESLKVGCFFHTMCFSFFIIWNACFFWNDFWCFLIELLNVCGKITLFVWKVIACNLHFSSILSFRRILLFKRLVWTFLIKTGRLVFFYFVTQKVMLSCFRSRIMKCCFARMVLLHDANLL